MHIEYLKIIAKEIAPRIAKAFSKENNNLLNQYLQIYGSENFREGLVITYEKIVLTQEGNIKSSILHDEFLKYLHGVLENMVSSEASNKLKYAFNVANKIFLESGNFDSLYVKSLLHNLLISCRSEGFSEDDIIKKFIALKNLAYKSNITYEEWCDEVILNTPTTCNASV